MIRMYLFVLFCLILCKTFGQQSNQKIVYVIDSILVKDDPEEGNEISQNDIADMRVIKNKDTLQNLGYGNFNAIIYLFTKEYRDRPDSLKQIPSSKQMERKNNVWYYKGLPYTGRVIDYYYSGKKQGDGDFINGKLEGVRKIYFKNGKVAVEKIYKSGLENGLDKEYYEDGSLEQEGQFLNAKEEGVWNSYYPNGQVKLRSTYINGEVTDSAFKFYSNGRIKERVFIKGHKVNIDNNSKKLQELIAKSSQSNKEEDTKAAIKYCSKAIELDSNYADAYFSRGIIKLNDFQFDEAIKDLDKALQLEPYMDVALANRAFARIRKYQFANSKTLSKNREVTVMASKDKVDIPKAEQDLICSDLKHAVFLGDKSKMITEALADYCK